VIAKSRLLT